MGRGGKVNFRRNFKYSVSSKDKGSDDSDEDYVVEVEQNASDYDESKDLGNSVDEYVSEESFGSYVDEEDEQEECRKVVRSKKTQKASRANGKIRGKTLRKRKRVSYEEEEGGDEDYVHDDDDDDDEEFTPDEDDDFLDEDEELKTVKRRDNMRVGKRSMPKRGMKKRRKSRVSKKPLDKKQRTNRRLNKKERHEYDDEYEGDFIDDSSVGREKSKKNSSVRRRKYSVYSDSDFASSGSSDYEYTISEEEREQVREANKLLEAKTRSSSSVKKVQENGSDLIQQGKSMAKKGKEKVKEVKSEMGKQVCGICLSEEDKRRFRGTLNCCSHYFCFTCIMEWSKVESRCPLCKQRFKTITKNGRAAAGVDLRNMVVEVPKRDQVYQPSEEELQSFVDPYENVICIECHEGGDDSLMLLCDLCDSPAHTYCVGLGRRVPEGNWYCDDCRHVALGSSSSNAQDPLPDIRTTTTVFNRSSLIQNNGEGLNPALESSPRLGFTQGLGNLPSPRFPTGDAQAGSPVLRMGAPTLSMRRQIQRHIHNILSVHRMQNMASRTEANPAPIPNLHNDLENRENGVQNSRARDLGLARSTFIDERLGANDHPSSSVQNDDPFSLRVQTVQDTAIVTPGRSVNLTLWPELTGISSRPGRDQLHQCSRPGIASEVNLLSHRVREESQFYVVKEQLQAMVRSHLKSLSLDIELGNDTFKDIVRSSTHTILAACGLEHKRSEVHLVPQPLICRHGDRVIAGQISIMKGFCSSCFDAFARDVVKRVMDTRLPLRRLSLDLNL